jgi:peptidoglycan/xylan/chitin deacetylase (PgdA/CDA1 family)
MKRQAKLLISSLFFAAVFCARRARALFGIRLDRGLTILYYHGVPANDARQFAHQMGLLARIAETVPASWQGHASAASSQSARPLVAITFDDALQSVFDNALPVLQRLNLPCTIFVPSGWIGQVPGWDIEGETHHAEPVATAETIRELDAAMVTVGSHTASHPRLSTLPADRIDDEIRMSRVALAALTGTNVDLLALPYGDYDERVVQACRSAGYRHVFTIQPQEITLGPDGFERGRVAVEPDDSLWEFYLKASGAYRWMRVASAIKQKLLRHAG